MTHSLAKIIGKTNDYKLCESCNSLNWYENQCCRSCSFKSFKEDGKGIEDYINEEYRFYKDEYDYSEDEIDEISKDI